MFTVQLAKTDMDLLKCWPVLQLLRPQLEAANYLPLVRSMLLEGYHLAFIEPAGQSMAAAAIGFRYLYKLHDGQQVYIDDLTTLEAYRGLGYAGALLDYVIDWAEEKGYPCVTLDSGPHRHAAHRLYLNKGFQLSSYHFIRKNSNGQPDL